MKGDDIRKFQNLELDDSVTITRNTVALTSRHESATNEIAYKIFVSFDLSGRRAVHLTVGHSPVLRKNTR